MVQILYCTNTCVCMSPTIRLNGFKEIQMLPSDPNGINCETNFCIPHIRVLKYINYERFMLVTKKCLETISITVGDTHLYYQCLCNNIVFQCTHMDREDRMHE